MDRIAEICSALKKGKVLADVGCDHGYCARLALKKGLFEKVYLSDISAGSLKKAEKLLEREIKEGKCVPVLADGMKGLPPDVDTLLIAGLGGEEIVRILEEGYLPEHFVFQPMKNAEKVREFLVKRGAHIGRDDTFFADGYFYDLIAGENYGGSEYTARELAFGKQNLREMGRDFCNKLLCECEKIASYLKREDMSGENRSKLEQRLETMRGILNETH